MITINTWKLRYADEMQVSIVEGDSYLKQMKFRFRGLSAENIGEMEKFLSELRNHFGFKLELDKEPIS